LEKSSNQSSSSDSKKTKMDVPILTIDKNHIQFLDDNKNNRIDGNENCSLSFEISNDGKGYAVNLTATINEVNNIGVVSQSTYPIGKIEPKSKKNFNIPFSGSLDLKNGTAKIHVNFTEQNGFQPDPINIDIPTREFEKPIVQVSDFAFLSDNGSIRLGYPIQLKTIIQNVGQGDAENVSIEFVFPEQNVYPNTESKFNINHLSSGQSIEIVFEFVANKLYKNATIPIKIQINERFQRYASNKNVEATVNSETSGVTVSVISNATSNTKIIKEASLRSDVDKDIPEGIDEDQKRYALIIGNEDYAKFQTGLDQEVNVAFARNDAEVMAQYVERTLGFAKQNIVLIKDATKGQMSQEIVKLLRYAELGKGEAEILFYYSGHGLPEETTKEPYLIPVDISGSQVDNGYSLSLLYNQLAEHPIKKCTVILDACFSGGARNKELVAMKGVKVKASVSNVPSNLVVMASSSGQESSAVFKEKQHGLFTYYLLKSLKESKGQSTYQETMNEVSEQVALEATRMNKIQTPQLLFGSLALPKIGTLGWDY
jgi:uncharacterized glyoxalase superfamily protein PhnB